MILTRLGHAALLVEAANTRALIDPGTYSADWHGLTDLDAVLITHRHADHVDVDNIGRLFQANRSARVIVEPAVIEMLDQEAESASVGDIVEIGDVQVEVVGGQHALIHERIPRVGNVGFVLTENGGSSVFHPGDSYATIPDEIDVLALPLTAPWARAGMTIDFANAVGAARMIPIHEATVNAFGRASYMRLCSGRIDDSITLDDVAIGEPYPV